MNQVTANIYQLKTAISSVYCIVHGTELILVDSGLHLERRLIKKQIDKLCQNNLQVSDILLTHAHPDHDGNALSFVHHFNCTLWVLTSEAKYARTPNRVDLSKLKHLGRFNSKCFKLMVQITPQSILHTISKLHDGDIYKGITVIEAQGHTPGSAMFLHHESKTLFSGDTLLNAVPPWIMKTGLSLPAEAYSSDYTAALASVKKIKELDFENLCTGHGPAIIGNAKEKVIEFLEANGI